VFAFCAFNFLDYHSPNNIFIIPILYPTMKLGRPENKRQRIISTIMNEKEERAFLEYFSDWKTNKEVTGIISKNSVKSIDTNVGRYCNKFTKKGWLCKSKKYLRYSFKTPKGKIATKGQFVPCYKSNINPFIDYFIFSSEHRDFDQFIQGKYHIQALNLFFELNEVREWFVIFARTTFRKPLNLYEAFKRVLDSKLIYYWLYFEGKYYPEYSKIVLAEEFWINEIPEVDKISVLIQKYLKDNRGEESKWELREEIINLFNYSWKEFEENKNFERILRINKAQNKRFPKSMLKKEVKIKYFSRLLYHPTIAEPIKKSFLDKTALSLIYLRNEKYSPEKNHLLKYQILTKKSASS